MRRSHILNRDCDRSLNLIVLCNLFTELHKAFSVLICERTLQFLIFIHSAET